MTIHPFYFLRGSIIIEGGIRKKTRTKKLYEVSFLVDTGAERTVADLDLLKNLGYENYLQGGLSVGTAGKSIEAFTVELISLEVLGMEFKKFEILTHTFSMSVPAHIILGMDILGRQEFCIDSANQLIKLH